MRPIFIALCLSLAATPASAERFALAYDGAAFGLAPLGAVSIDAEVFDDSYRIDAALESGGLLNLFERTEIRAAASGRIQGGALRWERYELDHRYSAKRRVIAMRAEADGAVLAEITPNYRLWGDPAASDEQRRRSRDPLSSLMAMAIDIGQTHRCAGAYPTFDGRFYYLLELAGGEIEAFRGGGYEGQVLKCALAYIAVAGFERGDAGRRRIPHGQIWFALAPNSNFAPPVRVATPLTAGAVVLRLRSWRRALVEIAATP